MRSISLALVFVLCGPLADSADERKGQKQQGSTLRVIAWPSREDAKLNQDSLKAQADGKPARILRLRGPGDDLLILLVLDLTGDLTAADQARQAISARLQALPATTWVGVLRAQDGLSVIADPSPDHAAAVSAVQSLQVAGRSSALDAMESAARLAAAIIKRSPLRAAVLIVTDGSIYNYREDYTNPVVNPSDSRDLSRRFPENLIREKTSKLAEHLSGFDVPVFLTQVSYPGDRLNDAYQNGLRQMAEATGGAAWFARAPAEIPGVIDQAFSKVQSHWSIDIELPPRLPRNFTVQIRNGDDEPQYRSRYGARRD